MESPSEKWVLHLVLLLCAFSQSEAFFLENEVYESFYSIFHSLSLGAFFNTAKAFGFVDVSPDRVFLVYCSPTKEHFKILQSQDLPNPGKEIKVLIHGWSGYPGLAWQEDMAKEYYKRYGEDGINVILVDYKHLASTNFLVAATGVKSVGAEAARKLWTLLGDPDLLKDVHVIGFSLGGHVAGFLGKTIQKLSGGVKIGRITGLSVAGPIFEFPVPKPKHWKLDEGDATFVDVIHTNAHLAGSILAMGHVDVYFNCGGPFQENCLLAGSLLNMVNCSHHAAIEIFTKTINEPNKYMAAPCCFFKSLINLFNPFKEKFVIGEYVKESTPGLLCTSQTRVLDLVLKCPLIEI